MYIPWFSCMYVDCKHLIKTLEENKYNTLLFVPVESLNKKHLALFGNDCGAVLCSEPCIVILSQDRAMEE